MHRELAAEVGRAREESKRLYICRRERGTAMQPLFCCVGRINGLRIRD
jgi:hypothetical protein